MELFYTFVFVAQAIVSTLTYKFFHDIYFRNTERGAPILRFFAYTPTFFQSFLSCYWELEPPTIMYIAALTSIFPILPIKTSWLQKTISYFLLVTMGMASEGLVVMFLILLFESVDGVPYVRSPEAVIMIAASRLVTLVFLYIYKRVAINKARKAEEEQQLGILSALFHIITFSLGTYSFYVLFLVIFPILAEAESTEGFLLGICIVYFFIANVISYIHNLDLEEYRRKTRLLHQEMERYSREHQALGVYLKELSVLKHDVKHQLLPILAELPQENQNIMDKFNHIFDTVFSEEYQYFSNFPSLDLLLNYQLYKAKQKNIDFHIQIEPNLKFYVEPDMFCVVLGNLLDNARESQEEMTDKKIIFHLFSQNTNLLIKVENSYEGKILLEQGLPPTTKSEATRHGLGLSTVKSLVERKGGVFRLTTENQVFQVEILLLNIQE